MIKKVLIWLGGLLFVVGLGILGRDARQLRRTEKKRDEMLAGDIVDNIKKAESLSQKAETQKKNAAAAAAATTARLEKISEKDSDMDDLLSAWKSERVRQQSS
jgi:hypothetical protein